MAYIGKQPVVGNFLKLDSITTSATTTFNLTSGGVAYYPQTATNCIVSLNGVIQSPISAYTISGSTIVFSDALTTSDVIDFIVVLGDVLSIGTPSNGTITSNKLASGTGGLVDWQSVQTSGFTAVAGKGYFCNTTSAAFTVTLPASPVAGDEIILVDYAGTWDTNALTINPNSNKIIGQTSNVIASKDRESFRLVYIDTTQGWIPYSGYQESTQGLGLPYSIDFLVIAGGGGGGGESSSNAGGSGGGAGGYRNSYSTETSGGGGSSETTLSLIPGTVYTITVGAGGNGGATGQNNGTSGNNSVFSTITSSGGGGGGSRNQNGLNGGSGGGAGLGTPYSGGLGTANQGYNGADSTGTSSGTGGGGAGSIGGTAGSNTVAGNGGSGLASSITGSSVTRAGGGGGGGTSTGGSATGGGGTGSTGNGNGGSATANTEGGGGGAYDTSSGGKSGGNGGSGVVILRMPTANYSGTTTGSPTVSTSGSDTILVYNASGSYTG